MTPVRQTIFHDSARPDVLGNCLQAALASMLDLPIEAVPHIGQQAEDNDADWIWLSNEFLRGRGLALRLCHDPEPGEYVLAIGPSERGVGHIVVVRDGALAHDPHPSDAGLMSTSMLLRVVSESSAPDMKHADAAREDD